LLTMSKEERNEKGTILGFSDILRSFSEYATIILLIIAGLSIFMQVILRYVFNTGFSWTEELARYLMIYISLIGSSIALQNKEHPRVEMLFEVFPAKVKAGLEFFFDILILVFLIVLFWQGIENARFGLDTRTPALQILWVWPYAAVPLGAVLMIMQLLVRIFAAFGHGQKRQQVIK
jgi:TRAP-type C4-dicarboxylate transport system permease small subunit